MASVTDLAVDGGAEKRALNKDAAESEMASGAGVALQERGTQVIASEDSTECDTASTSTGVSIFSSQQVKPWDPQRFRFIRKAQDATRNHGAILLMHDEVDQRMVAVKQVPLEWACEDHTDFVRKHPEEAEVIWMDIECAAFLNSVSFPYACEFLGVYRDDDGNKDGSVYMVSEFIGGGDLFEWCLASNSLPPPGPEREAAVRPIARQIFDGLRRLHELDIVHGDVALENVLIDHAPNSLDSAALSNREVPPQIRIIDFGRSSFRARRGSGGSAKPSYKAPEISLGQDHDGFLADAFAAGVALYALLTQNYPWISTTPGADMGFEYVKRYGLRAFLSRKKIFGEKVSVINVMSRDVVDLLEGLLAVCPAQRFTLGEGKCERPSRPSVWECAWLQV